MAHPRPIPDELRRPDAEDLVSVVIPARNEEASIGACLDSVLRQTRRSLEVIVVDGESTDATREIVRAAQARDPRVTLLTAPNRSIPASLNRGLETARGRWFVRVDAHATIPADYVARAIEHLRTGRWGGVGGRKDGVGGGPSGQAIVAAMGSRFGVGNSVYHYGTEVRTVDHVPFGAYPTELLRSVGGWNEALAANEDYELDYRLRQRGHALLFDPALRIRWQNRETLRDLFHQYRRYGRGKADVARLHPSSLGLRHLAAPGLVASWAAALALSPIRPWLSAAIALPYPAALAGGSLAAGRRVRGGSARLRIPLAFLAMHAGWGIGFWEGLARGLVRRPAHR